MLVKGLSKGPLEFRFHVQEMKYETLRRRFDVDFKTMKDRKRLVTFCVVKPFGETSYFFRSSCGMSICNPLDAFDEITGEKKALADVLSLLHKTLSDDDRLLIWQAWLKRKARLEQDIFIPGPALEALFAEAMIPLPFPALEKAS